MTVAELLTASRQAHLEYRQHAGYVDKAGKVVKPYDETVCVAAVTKALDTRQQAHAADPSHHDPAWSLDRAPHDELVQFYQKFLQ